MELHRLRRSERAVEEGEFGHMSGQRRKLVAPSADEKVGDARSGRVRRALELGLSIQPRRDAPGVAHEHDVIPRPRRNDRPAADELIAFVAVEKNQPARDAGQVTAADAEMVARSELVQLRAAREKVGRDRTVGVSGVVAEPAGNGKGAGRLRQVRRDAPAVEGGEGFGGKADTAFDCAGGLVRRGIGNRAGIRSVQVPIDRRLERQNRVGVTGGKLRRLRPAGDLLRLAGPLGSGGGALFGESGGLPVGRHFGRTQGAVKDGDFIKPALETKRAVGIAAEIKRCGLGGGSGFAADFRIRFPVEMDGDFAAGADEHDMVPVLQCELGFTNERRPRSALEIEPAGQSAALAGDAERVTLAFTTGEHHARHGANASGQSVPQPQLDGVILAERHVRAQASAREMRGAVDLTGVGEF